MIHRMRRRARRSVCKIRSYVTTLVLLLVVVYAYYIIIIGGQSGGGGGGGVDGIKGQTKDIVPRTWFCSNRAHFHLGMSRNRLGQPLGLSIVCVLNGLGYYKRKF